MSPQELHDALESVRHRLKADFGVAALYVLEVLGEAAKRVPAETRALAPSIAWRRIAGLRDG